MVLKFRRFKKGEAVESASPINIESLKLKEELKEELKELKEEIKGIKDKMKEVKQIKKEGN